MKTGLTNTKKIPSIILVEGLWGVGKSTLIADIRHSNLVLFVPEPNYIHAGIKSNISEWYREQHFERMELAKKYNSYGEHVIMERSILSSAAFYYAQHKSLPKWFSAEKYKLDSMDNLHVYFFYYSKKSFLKKSSDVQDKSVRSAIHTTKDFYENYIYFFMNIVPTLIGNKITCKKIIHRQSHWINILKQIKTKLKTRGIQKKIKESKHDCANAVIFDSNKKFLLLYSHKHRHFCLPQGHRKPSENLAQTIKREIIEETGFTNFMVIQKIHQYSYRFYNKKQIVHKIITCFLVELKSHQKTNKMLEEHESYTNYFFSLKEVFKKLNWAEDKETLKLAKVLLEK